jgi:hypothetical protein
MEIEAWFLRGASRRVSLLEEKEKKVERVEEGQQALILRSY